MLGKFQDNSFSQSKIMFFMYNTVIILIYSKLKLLLQNNVIKIIFRLQSVYFWGKSSEIPTFLWISEAKNCRLEIQLTPIAWFHWTLKVFL